MHLQTICLALAAFFCLAEGHSHHDRLVHDLLKDYMVSVDPGHIVLKFNIALLCSRYNKDTGELTSSVWESYAWSDSRLKWIPAEYGGISSIRLPSDLIWKPDGRLYSSIHALVERDDTNVVLGSDGSIIWVPPATFRTLCQTSSDQLKCEFRHGSWTYDANMIDLQMQGEGLDLENYNKACPLVVKDSKASVVSRHYPCCKEPYSSLDINITFQPRA